MKRLIVMMVMIINVGWLSAQEEVYISVRAEATPSRIQKGAEGMLLVHLRVAEGYHISDPTSGILEIAPKPQEGIHFGEAIFPKAEEDTYGYIYLGEVTVKVPFSVDKDVVEGERRISIDATVQPCAEAEGICYPPETWETEATFTIQGTGGMMDSDTPENSGIAGRLNRALARGSILAFLIVFLGGILTSLTPCVYPMIPITIAVIGAQASGGKLRGFVLSLFYVLGIAVTFSTLGVIAAKTGGLFGTYAQHPLAVALIATIFFVMGLSMLGAFVIQMPSSLATKLQGRKGSGFIGAFLTGLVAGLVVSPCISPLLVIILTWVAKTGSVALGVGLLFSFALGLGILFIVIGTFSGVLKNLPRSGGWMEIIERGFGLLLVILAIVFLKPVLPVFVYNWIWAALFLLLGTFIGAFSPLSEDATSKKKIAKALGVFLVILAACMIYVGFAERLRPVAGAIQESSRPPTEEDMWLSSDEEGFRLAQANGKPVLVDFFAEWCAACHELDEKVWIDPSVRVEMENYILVKLDLTKNDARTRSYQEKYGIIGMPTVIFFSSDGKERYRFEGFRDAEAVLKILKKYA